MNSLNKEFPVEIFVISGHPVVNVTLLVVIVLTYSHQMKMDGSGPDRESKLELQRKEIPEIGVTLEDTTNNNLTTVKLLKYD